MITDDAPSPEEVIRQCFVDLPEPESAAPKVDPADEEPAEMHPETLKRRAAADAAALRKEVEAFFQPDGPLQYSEQYGGRPYEYRAQQEEMALAVTDALLKPHNLCVEAPTGVGKSFAYLVPLILYSLGSKKPLVVTTETIHLQEQLIHKDLPLLKKLLKVDFKAALAKGRNNYLCLRRLSLMTGERRDEFLPLHSLAGDIDRVYRWSERSTDGCRENAGFRIDNGAWNLVCCETGNCIRHKCRFARQCFYWKARHDWEEADIIVANHALFFTDLKMQQDSDDQIAGLLPPYGAVVFDEAHTLEACAAEYLGIRLNQAGFNGLLNKLYNGETGRGLLLRGGAAAMELRAMVEELRETAHRFFLLCEAFLQQGEDGDIRRVREAGLFPDLIGPKLAELRSKLGDFAQEQEEADFKSEIEAQLHRCDAYLDSLNAFLTMGVPSSVYWVERDERQLSLLASPLNVPELLQYFLFERDFPVVLTSATLTIQNRFDYYLKRTGFTEGRSLRLDSPFDPEAVTLYLESDLPEPTEREFDAALPDKIWHYIEMTHGKAFVLFTSYAQMRRCADTLAGDFRRAGIRLLMQGGELSRSQMLQEFKADVDSVIFGTDSFWTGVDVPGEALSNVIITKLPFAVPSHPLIQARCEAVEQAGGKAFFDYSLPEAVLKFRQGAGRLIRSKSDRGVIVVLDKRLLTKRYGRMFIASLPDYPQAVR